MNPDHWTAERLPTLEEISVRLSAIFPEGLDGRGYLTREIAVKTIFVFLYIQASRNVAENRLRPTMVTDMTDEQAGSIALSAREAWQQAQLRPGTPTPPDRWYGENTREPIRDETIRTLVGLGAAIEDLELPPTSPKPRYQLARSFADLFDPELTADALTQGIARWQASQLTPGAQARLRLARRLAVDTDRLEIRWPQGGARAFPVGPSTPLAKAAVEEFLPRFLVKPAVLALAEGRRRLLFEDHDLLSSLGLEPPLRIMPDLLAADLHPVSAEWWLIILELVATDGAMTPERVRELSRWLVDRGHGVTPVLLGTVFGDRRAPAARRWAPAVAWGTFVWYASEPDAMDVRLPTPQPTALSLIVATPRSILDSA